MRFSAAPPAIGILKLTRRSLSGLLQKFSEIDRILHAITHRNVAADSDWPSNGRVELRLRPEDKATLTRAASIKRLDLTGYILGAALPKAEADIAEAERLTLSERDSLRVLALLESPPAAPDRLVRAAKAGLRLP